MQRSICCELLPQTSSKLYTRPQKRLLKFHTRKKDPNLANWCRETLNEHALNREQSPSLSQNTRRYSHKPKATPDPFIIDTFIPPFVFTSSHLTTCAKQTTRPGSATQARFLPPNLGPDSDSRPLPRAQFRSAHSQSWANCLRPPRSSCRSRLVGRLS